jgi:hypothetical protein
MVEIIADTFLFEIHNEHAFDHLLFFPRFFHVSDTLLLIFIIRGLAMKFANSPPYAYCGSSG